MILGLLFFEGKLCCPFSFRLCQTAKLEAWTQVEGQTIDYLNAIRFSRSNYGN